MGQLGLRAVLWLLSLAALHATGSPQLNRSGDGGSPGRHMKLQIYRKGHGFQTPAEAVGVLSRHPEALPDYNFKRCNAATIKAVMERLPENVQKALRRKIALSEAPAETKRAAGCPVEVDPLEEARGFAFSCRQRYGPPAGITPIPMEQFELQQAFLGKTDGTSASSDEDWSLSSEELAAESRDTVATTLRPRKQPLRLVILGSSSSDEEAYEEPSVATHQPTTYVPPTRLRSGMRNRNVRAAEPTQPALGQVPKRSSREELLSEGYIAIGTGYASPTRNHPSARSPSLRRSSQEARLGLRTSLRLSQSSTKYRGIENKASTCYVGAVLQALFHVPAVRDALRATDLEHVEAPKRAGVGALQRVFKALGKHAGRKSTDAPLREPPRATGTAGGLHACSCW